MKKMSIYAIPYILLTTICMVLFLSGCSHDHSDSVQDTATYQWHTFFGSAVADRAYGVATDGDNNAYIVGRSKDTWNGPDGETPLNPHSDPGNSVDFFVLKLASNGSYLWHTFYGVSLGPDYALNVAVDESNHVYVTGFSYDSWDGPALTPPRHSFSGGDKDAFILKLDSAGAYQWHTFYGSTDYEDEGQGIAVDEGGNVYVAVKSYDTWDGPGSTDPIHPYSGGDDVGSQTDVAVLKLDSAGDYIWHTFYGSTDYISEDYPGEEPTSLAVDGDSNVYVAGFCISSWTGSSGEGPLNAFAGGDEDAFVLKLNSAGVYQWHTFYGSTETDWANGIVLKNGNVYVTGFSGGTWNGPSGQSPLHAYAGDDDIIVFKLDSTGTYQWHTFFGSALYNDYGLNLAFDDGDGLYIAGRSYAPWQGTGNTDAIHAYAGGADIAVMKLKDNGAYCWHAFYGSASDDWGQGIALDNLGNIHAIGYSNASWDVSPPLHAYTGDMDIVDVLMKRAD
jgi:hypothetical protein